MNRLDQLAQPIRRNGEHMRAILERERRERELEMLDETASLGGHSASGRRGPARGKRAGSASAGGSGTSTATGIMSRSMTHLAGCAQRERGKYSLGGGISTSFRPLSSGQRDSSKSMTQISYSWSTTNSTNNNHQHHHYHYPQQQQEQRQSNLGLQTAATKKYLQSSFASFNNLSSRRAQQQYANSTITNPKYRYHDLDPNSLLFMNSSSLLVNAGVCDQQKQQHPKKTTTTNYPTITHKYTSYIFILSR